ncbi:hypothetical protein GCM10009526_19570 [Glutamicibacter creatinolyticus]
MPSHAQRAVHDDGAAILRIGPLNTRSEQVQATVLKDGNMPLGCWTFFAANRHSAPFRRVVCWDQIPLQPKSRCSVLAPGK